MVHREAVVEGDRAEGALAGIRILDMTSGIAGPLGVLLLAEQGADVVKVEPPGGDPLRSMPGSHVWHRSRRSVTLDLKVQADRKSFLRLLATADVLVESFKPKAMARLGLSYEDLEKSFPRLVYASVPGYPSSSRHSGRPGYDALVQARTGLQTEQPGGRDGPIFLHFPAPSMATCFLVAIGITTALCARQQTGRGQQVETSLFQGALAYTTMLWQDAERFGPGHHAMLAKTNPPGVHQTTIYECIDGWMHASTMNGLTPTSTLQEVAGLKAQDPALLFGSSEDRRRLDEELRAAFRGQPTAEMVAAMTAANLGSEAIVSMCEAYAHPQLTANGMVVSVDDPELGATTQIGIPVTLSRNPGRVLGGRPAPGAHNEEILREAEPAHHEESAGEEDPSHRQSRNALEGVVVLDLGQYLAGPYGAMILSDLGADVIKVEPIAGDAMRFVPAPFVGCQRGKRSIALDIRKPEGLEVFYKLVERADIVQHNMTKGTAARLGVDYETLRKYKPDLIYCNTYAYGEEGPLSHSGGLDPLYQAASGLEYEAGPVAEGNPPLYLRMGMCDTGNAFLSVVGLVLALYRRGVDQKGQSVTTSLLNAGAVFSSEIFLTEDGPVDYPKLDKEQSGLGPLYRLYRTYDGWIQIAAVGAGHFPALCEALGRKDLSSDERFESAAGRKRNRAALEDILSLVFREKTSQQLQNSFDAAGVPNEIPVDTRNGESILHDEENLRLGLSVAYEHPLFGMLHQFGQLIFLSDTPGRIAGPPPLVGQHTQEILRACAFGAEEIESLKAAGVVGWTEPGDEYGWSC